MAPGTLPDTLFNASKTALNSVPGQEYRALEGEQDSMNETAEIVANSFQKQDLLIYPTKTSAIVNVIITSESKKTFSGTFLDMNGKLIRNVILDAIHNELNLKDFEVGTYTFRIISSDKQVTETRITIDRSIEP